MSYLVRLTPEAEADIDSISSYIYEHDSLEKALYVVREINKTIDKLDRFPERGGHPVELLRMDDWNYRETLFGPYRIFYRVEEKTVYVVAVADGRRDLISFLAERLG